VSEPVHDALLLIIVCFVISKKRWRMIKNIIW